MGCSSSKPTKPKVIQADCCICTQSYDSNTRKPITLGYCGHSICDECKQLLLQRDPAEITCPLCKKKSPEAACNVNYAMLDELQLKPLQNPTEVALQLPISATDITSCKNGHKTTWISEDCKCYESNCRSQSSGFRCNDCKTYRCETCSGYVFDFKTCPNNHSTSWKIEKRGCNKCKKMNSGMSCKQCSYHICVICAEKAFETGKCGMGHPLAWSSQLPPCVRCSTPRSGFCCLKCRFQRCWKCAELRFDANQCPNRHKLTLNTKKNACVSCGKYDQGKSCKECSFHLCDQYILNMITPERIDLKAKFLEKY